MKREVSKVKRKASKVKRKASKVAVKTCVEYSSNNSGGSWWLTDEDWRNLEKAGWEVCWHKDNPDRKHWGLEKGGRWLGSLASGATRRGLSLEQAVDEWERVTGKSSTDAGCACCGPPHHFTEYAADGTWLRSGPDASYEAHW